MVTLLSYLNRPILSKILVVKKKPFSIPEHISIPIVRMISSVSMGILGTGFCTIFLNLGRRQPGDVRYPLASKLQFLSAYSIFNEDFRELPGTLNADAIDRDIRIEVAQTWTMHP
ncbi:uncharacterized protein [Gossypium hirsutum]|uniref:Uncharacterized protein isoform X1 n=1 Tax=Gossypium hirsutum TaxID=3635 RepID=A0A1U8PNA4_GOSHI|nr:uncharacterized protein LOC107960101 isoform X1 [Gossypium hirsutum]XP_016751808.2 uncharacterized protein LOC107960101 isoform X1 [Gossypium hirsutum]XP_040968370.1 uncharacterized protein LOC107960101 isoform X1 [Gossypium hirsutum]